VLLLVLLLLLLLLLLLFVMVVVVVVRDVLSIQDSMRPPPKSLDPEELYTKEKNIVSVKAFKELHRVYTRMVGLEAQKVLLTGSSW
jgi:hypothetical protein